MIEKPSTNITEAEAQLYDRQVNLKIMEYFDKKP